MEIFLFFNWRVTLNYINSLLYFNHFGLKVKIQLYFEECKGSVAPPSILDTLTPDDTRQLVISEDELATSRRLII